MACNRIELWNGASMLPYAYLTYASAHWIQSFLITAMWLSSMGYHLAKSLDLRHAWPPLFLLDCIFQMASLLCLFVLSPCHTPHSHFGAPFHTLLLVATIFHDPAKSKKRILAITCASHLSFLAYGSAYACDPTAFRSALVHFACAAATFLLSETHHLGWWPLGHLFLAAYTYRHWQALDMVRTKTI